MLGIYQEIRRTETGFSDAGEGFIFYADVEKGWFVDFPVEAGVTDLTEPSNRFGDILVEVR
jgi:hypothetical protein